MSYVIRHLWVRIWTKTYENTKGDQEEKHTKDFSHVKILF